MSDPDPQYVIVWMVTYFAQKLLGRVVFLLKMTIN